MKKLIIAGLLLMGIGFGFNQKTNADDVLNNKYIGTGNVHSIEIEYNNKKWMLLQDDFELFFFIPEYLFDDYNLEANKDYNISYTKSDDMIFYVRPIENVKYSNNEMWTNKKYLNETINVLKNNETSYYLQIKLNTDKLL